MAERRRIIPASVGPLFQPKEEKSWKPAVRFELTLDDPSDTKSSEYSYRDLYKNAVGETEDDKSFNDLEEDDISGLAALAKRFEEKYGTQDDDGAKKKKRRDRFDELLDVGMGYDDTDPFVDNSECYDELVPSVLTTQLGGFYINQGQLQFREISDSEDDDDFIHAAKSRKKKSPKVKKKRKSSFEEKERKRRKQEKKAKKQLQKQFGSKKKKVSGSPTVAELLKRQQLQDAFKSSTSSSGKLVNGNSNGSSANSDPLDHIDPSLDLGLDLKMDSDMAKVMEEALASIQDGDALGMDDDSIGNGNMDSPSDNSGEQQQYAKCPENLSSELLSVVEKIKDAARKSVEGKCKFFTPSVNQLLLRIELHSRDLTCSKRSQLYNHLASHLPCGKETLLKRAKKLRLGAQDVNIKEPLQKLKEAIAKVMPENIHRYQEECQVHALEKANSYGYHAIRHHIESEEEHMKLQQDDLKKMAEGKEEGRASDEEDDRKSKQGNWGPRKKFQWTDEIRKLLCDVVRVKVKTYEVMKSRSQSAEDYFRFFLDNEVKPLWPQGWIQTRMLYKETRSVHGHLTSSQAMKPKKVVLATKKSGFKKPNTEGTPTSQMSVASMITHAIMSPTSGASNQSTPASDKGTPSSEECVPTLLDYANSSVASADTSPSQKSNSPQSIQSTPTSSAHKDNTNNAAASSLYGKSAMDASHLTASFMEKLIADELAASDKAESQAQVQRPPTQSPQASGSNQPGQVVAKPKTSPPQGQNPMSIREIVAATAKAIETSAPKERQQPSSAASVLKQLSTHAQNNASVAAPQTYVTSKPSVSKPTVQIVRKVDTSYGHERLKKLSIGDGKRTLINIQKQPQTVTGASTLTQTIQKLSSSIASSRAPTTSASSSTVAQSSNKQIVVTRVVTSSVQKQNTINSGSTVVRLQHPPTAEKVSSSSQPQIRLASSKSSAPAVRVISTAKARAALINANNSKQSAQPVRTAMSKQPTRVNVKTLSTQSGGAQVGHLTPANLQAGMGNIFANLSESMYGKATSASTTPQGVVSSKELPYYAAATSGKNSHPKSNQGVKTSHGYRQQTSPTGHSVHQSSYSPTKVTKQQALSSSGSAFTAPSPPKLHKQPSTSPTLSPSTSPVGQKYPAYISQRTSPSQTSPKYPYTTTMAAAAAAAAAMPGYQQLSLADLTKQAAAAQAAQAAASGYAQGYPLSANQGQGSAGGAGDAIITGPAPGTFYHQHAGTGGMLGGPMQSPTEQPYHQLPPWAQ